MATRVGSTTNPHTLATLMSVVGEEQDQIPALTVICTYDSLKKVLVYFNLISDAHRVTRELPHTLRLLARTDPGLVPGVDPQLFFAHAEHTPANGAAPRSPPTVRSSPAPV
ncbi:hypothetical protein [Streptomyces sp. NPDC040750]|uniref:hypothetical protein n=1 Tax=Streptomyces sp. NPDC040750 TaxID=3154491 RepID=UPI0033F8A518